MKTAAFIFFLFFSINTFAQSRQVISVDSSKKNDVKSEYSIVMRCTSSPIIDTPLIIINEKIYKKGLNTIKADDILSINVIKAEKAIPVYGSQGVNGVIVLKMKTDYKIDTLTIKK